MSKLGSIPPGFAEEKCKKHYHCSGSLAAMEMGVVLSVLSLSPSVSLSPSPSIFLPLTIIIAVGAAHRHLHRKCD
jgi:hypothetical protein